MASTEERINNLLAANARFAEDDHQTPLTMPQMRERPGETILVLTCLDGRTVPEQFFGPNPGVAVFRNAGGRVTPDFVRSLTVLRTLRAKAKGMTVMIIHHTDCGMTHITDEEIAANVTARGIESREFGKGYNYGSFTSADMEKVILEDMKTLEASEMLKDTTVRGFVFETESGRLREVKA